MSGSASRPLLPRVLRRLTWVPKHVYTRYWLRPRGNFIVSYPKSGRTWLRVMLASILTALTGRPFTLSVHTYADPERGIPRIFFTHDGAGFTNRDAVDAGKEFYRGKAVLLLVRDPRDVLVSHYHQATKRVLHGPMPPDLDAFMRSPYGIDRILAFMNGWAARQSVPARFTIVRYEDMHLDREGELRRCVEFFGISGVTDAIVATAAARGSFESMRAMEAANAVDDARLRARDPSDPDSFKVRKGRVGGHTEELTAEQIQFLDARIRTHLSPVFSYYIH